MRPYGSAIVIVLTAACLAVSGSAQAQTFNDPAIKSVSNLQNGAKRVVIESGEQWDVHVGSNETFGDVLIDIARSGADVRIRASGSGWTIQNVGVRGEIKEGYALGLDGEDGTVENLYLGDGAQPGTRNGTMGVWIVHSNTKGPINFRRVHFAKFPNNGIYGSPTLESSSGGIVNIYNSYFDSNNISNFKLGSPRGPCEVVNTVIRTDHSTTANPRGQVNKRALWALDNQGSRHRVILRDSDIQGPIVAEAGAIVELDQTRWSGSFHDSQKDNDPPAKLVGSSAGSPDLTPPQGVPMTPKQAALGEGNFGVEISGKPARGAVPLQVQFEATPRGGAKPYQYEWAFDDGSTATGQTVTHTFQTTGTYAVELTATDADGASATATRDIEVLAPDAFVFSPIEYFGDARNWEPKTPSRWTVADRGGDARYILDATDYSGNSGRPGEYSLLKDRTYSGFELTFDVQTGEDLSANSGADFAVVFGWQNEQNFYFLLGKTEVARIFSVEDGERRTVGEFDTGLLPDESWHRVTLERRERQMEVSLDRTSIGSVPLPVPESGRIGLGAYNESVAFDGVDIQRPGDAGDAGRGSDGDGSSRDRGDTHTSGDAGNFGAGGDGAGSDAGAPRVVGRGGCSTAGDRVPFRAPLGVVIVGLIVAAGRRRSGGRTNPSR